MVHGINRNIRYLIHLKNQIDLYDDFLPICIAERKMFEILDNKTIVVLNHSDLYKRYYSNEIAKTFESKLEKTYYGKKTKAELEEEALNLKYHYALLYSSELKIINKNNYDTTKIYTLDEIKEFQNRIQEINKTLYGPNKQQNLNEEDIDNLNTEKNELQDIIKYNPLFEPSTGPEIIDIEKQLTNIELTHEEKEMIERIKSNPCIKSNIEAEGFQLYSHHW
jgi:hypothetical protein